MERREFEFLKAHVHFLEAKTVVEVGVQRGDMAVYLAQAVQANGGKYIGFDLWGVHGQDKQYKQVGSKESVIKILHNAGCRNYHLVQVDTINKRDDFERELDLHCPDGIDFAFIDGDHSYLGVANDFDAIYSRLSSRGVIAFHDTAVIDGCREFMYDLHNKFNDGTYDLIDYPFGSENRHCGISILSKKSLPTQAIAIDEICGSISDAKDIEESEAFMYSMRRTQIDTTKSCLKINEIKMKTDKIGYYPNRKKYD